MSCCLWSKQHCWSIFGIIIGYNTCSCQLEKKFLLFRSLPNFLSLLMICFLQKILWISVYLPKFICEPDTTTYRFSEKFLIQVPLWYIVTLIYLVKSNKICQESLWWRALFVKSFTPFPLCVLLLGFTQMLCFVNFLDCRRSIYEICSMLKTQSIWINKRHWRSWLRNEIFWILFLPFFQGNTLLRAFELLHTLAFF